MNKLFLAHCKQFLTDQRNTVCYLEIVQCARKQICCKKFKINNYYPTHYTFYKNIRALYLLSWLLQTQIYAKTYKNVKNYLECAAEKYNKIQLKYEILSIMNVAHSSKLIILPNNYNFSNRMSNLHKSTLYFPSTHLQNRNRSYPDQMT